MKPYIFISLIVIMAVCCRAGAEIGSYVLPPSKADYSTESIIASGQRGGDLHPVGTNFTEKFNREMGEAMEIWNAHDWGKALNLLQKIYKENPQSPWAAEAELHEACYLKYNSRYDDAEDKFIAIFMKYSNNENIQKRVLHYLPDIYARTGRLRVAQEVLSLLGNFRLGWQERQFVENWSRIYFSASAADENERLCGTKALALAMEAAAGNDPDRPLNNISLDNVYRKYPWALIPATHPDGYSLHELATISGGRVRHVSYEDLKSIAKPGMPTVAYLNAPAIPKVYAALDHPLDTGSRYPAGHFLVVESADDGIVEVIDPNGSRARWKTSDFKYRWSGKVLILSSSVRGVGNPVDDNTASRLRGGCCGAVPPDPDVLPINIPAFVSCPVSAESVKNAPDSRVNGPGGQWWNRPVGCFPCPDTEGSPGYSFGMAYANFTVMDTPMWYPSANGPGMRIELSHNRVNTQNLVTNNAANYYIFGNKWSCNFSSCIKETPAGDPQVIVENGRVLEYTTNAGKYVALDIKNFKTLSVYSNYYRLTYPVSRQSLYFETNTLNEEGQQLAIIEDRYTNRISCQYDQYARLTNVVDDLGRYFRLEYNTNGLVTTIYDQLNRHCDFVYDSNRNLISITDMGDYTTLLRYDDNNWITNLVYPSGAEVVMTYEGGTNIGYMYASSLYIPDGNPAFRVRVIDSLRHTNEMLYHAFYPDGPITVTDPNGNAWLYATDEYPKSRFIAAEGVNDHSFTQDSYLADQYAYRNYDTSYNLIKETFSVVNTDDYLYASSDSYSVEYTYANPTNHWMTGASWFTNGGFYASWSNSYDCMGNLICREDPMGYKTTFSYDNQENPTSVVNSLGNSINIQYNNNGNITHITDASENATHWKYDEDGWNTAIEYANTTSNTMSRDAIGRIHNICDSAGMTLDFAYDDLDRITQINYTDGSYIHYDYSCCGLESIIDRAEHTNSFNRDILGRISGVVDALNNEVQFAYDALVNITSLTVFVSGQPVTTRFGYTSTNGFTRLTSRTSPLGKTTAYTYTFRGNLASKTDAKWQTTSYTYDMLSRLTRLSWGSGTNVDINYDVLSRVTQITDPLATHSFDYDAVGQATNESVSYSIIGFSNISYRLDYQYDPYGNPISMILRGITGFTNVIGTYASYNNMNQVLSVSNSLVWSAYGYDYAGRYDSAIYGNGDVVSNAYDVESRLVAWTLANQQTSLVTRIYQQNVLGMITNIVDNGVTNGYGYNAIGQLVREQLSNNVTTWSYDEIGNRLSQSLGEYTNTFIANADNELLEQGGSSITVQGNVEPGPNSNKWYNSWAYAHWKSAHVNTNDGTFSILNVPVKAGTNLLIVTVRDVSGNWSTQTVAFTKALTEDYGLSYTYDDNGNLASSIEIDGGQEVQTDYFYDMENRLVKVTKGGQTILECWYDGIGRRIAKREVVGNTTNQTQYVYNGMAIIAVLDGQGQMLEYYTRGPGLAGDIGSIIDETKFSNGAPVATYYYHHNHRGDITHIRSGTNTVATYTYSPFGELISSSGSFNARFRFSSKELDPSTGLYNFGIRYYSPQMARWITPDPLWEAGGLNLYTYCANNPVNLVDPFGLQFANEALVSEELRPLTIDQISVFIEPLDLIVTAALIYNDPYNLWSYAGILPGVPAIAGKAGRMACAAKSGLRGVDDLVDAAAGMTRSSGDIVVQGGRARAKELFREFDVKGIGNRSIVRDKTGGGRGVVGALEDGTAIRIRMKPDGTTRIQAGQQKFIFPTN